MRYDVLCDRFLDWCRVERGLAENTVLAYASDLAAFGRWIGERDVGAVRQEDVLAHLGAMAGEGLAPPTQARALSYVAGQ